MNRVLLLTSVILLTVPCLAFGLAKAYPADSSTKHYTPSYPNRIVLIRHAEKGWSTGQNVSSTSEWHNELPHPKGDPDAPTDNHPGRGRRGRPPGRGGFPGRGGPPKRGGRGWPGKGDRRGPPNGLSEFGKQRAKFLPTLFGKDSEYDFGKIFAAPRDGDAKEEERTFATVAPLAEHLGLEIDITSPNSEPSCIVAAIEDFAKTSGADILISWKHFELNRIATALGAHNARSIYPGERNDVIWIMKNGEITTKRSMHCPKLDDDRIDEGDPDLIVENPSEPGVWAGLRGLVGYVTTSMAGVFRA